MGEQGGVLPTIPFGTHRISRLICGSNTLNGGSHLSAFVNQQMRRYFTDDQVMRTLRRCEEMGISAWQSGSGNLPWYRRYVAEGGRLLFISLGADNPAYPTELTDLAEACCIAVAHHGEVTDVLFKEGRIDDVRPYLDRIREAGMMAGISTHIPAVVECVEEKGWDVDFYMCCVYERHRTEQELVALLGQAPIPVGEVYLPGDPPRMYAAMRATSRPCLAFKILAAGRLSDRPEWVEQAFRQTLESIKPIDGVIVGMYDEYSDQPAENAELVRRFGNAG
jgi:hypothetical protein